MFPTELKKYYIPSVCLLGVIDRLIVYKESGEYCKGQDVLRRVNKGQKGSRMVKKGQEGSRRVKNGQEGSGRLKKAQEGSIKVKKVQEGSGRHKGCWKVLEFLEGSRKIK